MEKNEDGKEGSWSCIKYPPSRYFVMEIHSKGLIKVVCGNCEVWYFEILLVSARCYSQFVAEACVLVHFYIHVFNIGKAIYVIKQ